MEKETANIQHTEDTRMHHYNQGEITMSQSHLENQPHSADTNKQEQITGTESDLPSNGKQFICGFDPCREQGQITKLPIINNERSSDICDKDKHATVHNTQKELPEISTHLSSTKNNVDVDGCNAKQRGITPTSIDLEDEQSADDQERYYSDQKSSDCSNEQPTSHVTVSPTPMESEESNTNRNGGESGNGYRDIRAHQNYSQHDQGITAPVIELDSEEDSTVKDNYQSQEQITLTPTYNLDSEKIDSTEAGVCYNVEGQMFLSQPHLMNSNQSTSDSGVRYDEDGQMFMPATFLSNSKQYATVHGDMSEIKQGRINESEVDFSKSMDPGNLQWSPGKYIMETYGKNPLQLLKERERNKADQEKEKPYECSMCHKTFGHRNYLRRHFRIHTGEKPFKCEYCDKRFTQYCHLQKHVRIHTGEKPYKCEVCGKAFCEPQNLQTHMRVHTGEKPYKCEVCHTTFSVLPSLRKHIRIHTGEKPYKCEICDQTFSQSQSLTQHLRSHTGEKPYKCEICGKAFGRSQILAKHIRTHTGDKPYTCEICGKAFSQSTNLQKHLWTHTDEKRYKCEFCDEAYKAPQTLKKHMATHIPLVMPEPVEEQPAM